MSIDKLWIDPDYRALFNRSRIFEDMQAVEGEIFRKGKGRVTLRFELKGHRLFVKRHSGIGWREIFKDLIQGRLPVLGALNEWYALERLLILNISSLTPVAFGQRGLNPATRESFLVTRELRDTISLEDLVKTWQQRPDFVVIKRAIIKQLALVVRRMHRNGINHRDLYICHIHVSHRWLDSPVNEPELFVIDLHRAQIRPRVPERWQVKDIASLHFSSLEAGLTSRDRLRFMRAYRDAPLRATLRYDSSFWQEVEQRTQRLTTRNPEASPSDKC